MTWLNIRASEEGMWPDHAHFSAAVLRSWRMKSVYQTHSNLGRTGFSFGDEDVCHPSQCFPSTLPPEALKGFPAQMLPFMPSLEHLLGTSTWANLPVINKSGTHSFPFEYLIREHICNARTVILGKFTVGNWRYTSPNHGVFLIRRDCECKVTMCLMTFYLGSHAKLRHQRLPPDEEEMRPVDGEVLWH